MYATAITSSATTSSTTDTVTRNSRAWSGTRLPTSASRPSASAVSVDIATPQPTAPGPPWLTARKMPIGRSMPTTPAAAGRMNRRRSRRSPRSNSRRASSPTTRKNSVISPLFTHSRRVRSTLIPPSRTDSSVPQNCSYDPSATLAQTSATTIAPTSTAALPASVRSSRRTGVPTLRFQAVRSLNCAVAEESLTCNTQARPPPPIHARLGDLRRGRRIDWRE